MDWQPMIDFEEERIWRGTVFRLPVAEHPHEAPLDLLLVEDSAAQSGFSLFVSTGYKSGLPLLKLPASAKARGKVQAISLKWLGKELGEKGISAVPHRKSFND